VIKGAGGGNKEAGGGLTPLQASAVLKQWYTETPGKVCASLFFCFLFCFVFFFFWFFFCFLRAPYGWTPFFSRLFMHARQRADIELGGR
jgi:hypothetical protein